MPVGFKVLKTPFEVKNSPPLCEETKHFIVDARRDICRILCGNSPKTLIVTGPCSIHDEQGAIEYAGRLAQLQKKVKDTFLLMMRVYFEKPRTRTGWKGLLYDPHLNGTEDLEEGILWTRRIMRDVAEFKIPIASEIVDPLCFHFFDDLICWLCIGARTTTSQVHRQNVSGMSIFTGFKNDTNGGIANAIDSVVASDIAHTYIGVDQSGRLGIYKSEGNPFVHVILRGAKHKPNYHPEDIQKTVELLENSGLNPYLMIDCSHDNCNKDISLMPGVFMNVIEQIKEGNPYIKGIMLESYLLPGNQSLKPGVELNPHLSITDPCIGWETTEQMILDAHQMLKQ